MYNLTNSDKQVLQSAINVRVGVLKAERSKLFVRLTEGSLCKAAYESGRRKLNDRILQLHEIKRKMGIWEGFSQQPGSPYRDEPVSSLSQPWSKQGGSCEG